MARINRRTFIKSTGAAVGATALAACTKVPPSSAPTTQPARPEAPTAQPAAAPTPYDAVKPTAADLALAQRWLTPILESGDLPISMTYGDQDLVGQFKGWSLDKTAAAADDRRTEHVITRKDPATGLTIRWQAIAYADFPAVEWVLYLKNEGSADTPILDSIEPLDFSFPATPEQTCTILYANGSQMKLDDFAPQEKTITEGLVSVASTGGRSSDGAMPFCNLSLGQASVLIGIGWTGNWEMNFRRWAESLQVTAGMQRTHLKLHPGEEIRSPRILLLFWDGERLRGNNLLRRFLLAHKTPRRNGQPVQLPIVDGAWGERTTESHLAKIHWLQEQKLGVDAFWIDAGWYGDSPFNPKADTWGEAWANQVGSWYPNKTTYPQGLKPVGDACKAAGLDFVLWFEPERVHKDSDIARNHFEYTLSAKLPAALRGADYLFDLGNPAARQWLTDRISSLIEEGGVTIYRQDFNISPSTMWQGADVADSLDRIGIHEIRHIEGLYAFLDDLVARHPGLLIDNCASGGRRLDLEMMARSFPLHPSDSYGWPDTSATLVFMQNLTNSLSLWYPVFLARVFDLTPYGLRGGLGAGMGVGCAGPTLEDNQTLPLDLVRRHIQEELQVRKYFYGDFYSLTAPTLSRKEWAAWQFDRPDLGEGIVQAFRREDNEQDATSFKLHGLDPAAQYEVTDADTKQVARAGGRALLEQGLAVTTSTRPAALLFRYRKIAGG
ncbi:MAG: alpha-galactosidase [Chloroflexi bacterium]|nr:alpha-galactosidase [Chloroflexota bacterium]